MKLDLDSGTLLASLFWGALGTGFWIYGWKQKDMTAWFGGVALIAISYFVSSAWVMSGLAVVAIAAVYWIKKRY